MFNTKEVRYKPKLHVSVNSISWIMAAKPAILRDSAAFVVVMRVASASNTASHDNHEKNQCMGFLYFPL